MSPEGNSGALRVFIVEDEPILAMNAEDMLNELGHKVTAIATRLDTALALAENSEFNLAILDINLAGSTSFEVADILRKKGIPFIFTTGYGVNGLDDSYRGQHLLTKPFGVPELEHMIAQVLSADAA
jgi:CheY-like chemotaxis protein